MLPDELFVCVVVVCFIDSEISAFLASSGPVKEEGWMAACRKQYCKALSSAPCSLRGTGTFCTPRYR